MRKVILLVLAAIAAIAVLAGCTLIKEANAKEKVVELMKSSYAEGGQLAISNKVEKLVASGDLSRKQADKVYELAEKLYRDVLKRLETEVDISSLE